MDGTRLVRAAAYPLVPSMRSAENVRPHASARNLNALYGKQTKHTNNTHARRPPLLGHVSDLSHGL